jgi:hypothetical protein
MSRALPSPLSCRKTLPPDMLGGLAKANTLVAKPEGHIFAYSSPSTCSGAWPKANLRVLRPEETTPNEHEAFCHRDACLVEKRSPDLSLRLHTRAPTSRKPPR